MQQRNIRFWSEGIECAGTLYLPEEQTSGHTAPALVLGHGTASVKEMHLPHFAQHFVNAGLIALAIDYRFLGESEGEPRQTSNPRAQVDFALPDTLRSRPKLPHVPDCPGILTAQVSSRPTGLGRFAGVVQLLHPISVPD